MFGPPNIKKLIEQKNIKGLLRALENRDNNIVRDASFALANFGIYAPTGLIFGITDTDWKIRQEAYLCFANFTRNYFIPVLAAMHDPNETIRMKSILALLYKNEKRAAKALEGCLLNDPSAQVRIAAAVALKKLGRPQSVKVLIMASQDQHPEVRQTALESLGELGYR